MKEPYLLWAPAIQIRMTEPGADRTPPFRFNPLITRGNPQCSRPHGRETSAVINTGTVSSRWCNHFQWDRAASARDRATATRVLNEERQVIGDQ